MFGVQEPVKYPAVITDDVDAEYNDKPKLQLVHMLLSWTGILIQ